MDREGYRDQIYCKKEINSISSLEPINFDVPKKDEYWQYLPALPMKSAYMRHCLGSSSKRLPNRPPGRHQTLLIILIR